MAARGDPLAAVFCAANRGLRAMDGAMRAVRERAGLDRNKTAACSDSGQRLTHIWTAGERIRDKVEQSRDRQEKYGSQKND
jgi:hypothetical protein